MMLSESLIAWRFTSPFPLVHELVLLCIPLLKEEGGAIVRLLLSESLIDADFKISRINLFHTLLRNGSCEGRCLNCDSFDLNDCRDSLTPRLFQVHNTYCIQPQRGDLMGENVMRRNCVP